MGRTHFQIDDRDARSRAAPERAGRNRRISLAPHLIQLRHHEKTPAACRAPGVSIAVVRGSDTLAYGGWGKSDIENDVAASPRTVYRIGSITKQFTSTAVMELVEQKKVKLDDSIATYLTTLPVAWHKVTVRQLLNHTSGIPSYTDIGPRWIKRWGEAMTPDTLIALTANDAMSFTPGANWRYDNSGYVVLGMLIEKFSGRPWAIDIEEIFSKQLGLTDTRNCDTRALIMHRAQGYEQMANGLFTNAAYLAMSQPYAAGALCSTVGDLAKWNRALGSGEVVSKQSYQMMTTPEGAAIASKYGFGLSHDTLVKRDVIRHSGGINGFTSDNAWFPESQTSITVLTNSGSARSNLLLNQVARAAFGIPLLRVPSRAILTAEKRAQYPGVYVMKLGSAEVDFTITERNGEMFAQLGRQAANPLIPLGNNVFGAGFDDKLRITFTVENNKAVKLTLFQNGNTAEGMRKP